MKPSTDAKNVTGFLKTSFFCQMPSLCQRVFQNPTQSSSMVRHQFSQQGLKTSDLTKETLEVFGKASNMTSWHAKGFETENPKVVSALSASSASVTWACVLHLSCACLLFYGSLGSISYQNGHCNIVFVPVADKVSQWVMGPF